MWHNIRGKIDAIKAIKELAFIIVEDTNVNGVKVQRIKVDLSLKDAKDLVEVIANLEPKAAILDLEEKIKHMHNDYNALELKYWDLVRKLNTVKNTLTTF